jgi:hypothetical protein
MAMSDLEGEELVKEKQEEKEEKEEKDGRLVTHLII